MLNTTYELRHIKICLLDIPAGLPGTSMYTDLRNRYSSTKNMMCYYNDSVIDQIELSISQKLQKNQKNKGTGPIQT